MGTLRNSSCSFLLNLGSRRGARWRLSAGLVLPQGLCESLCPHSSWTPVRAAGEADAKHLPMGHTLAAAPLSLPTLWETREGYEAPFRSQGS